MASLRNYNAFLKAIKAKHGLTHRQAQRAAKAMREHIGRPVRGVDVAKHPRISKRFATQARKKAPRPRPSPKRAPEPKRAPAGVPPVIRDLPQYERLMKEFEDDFDNDIDYETTATYKEA